MALSGTLSDLNISNIIQLNCTEKNTAQVVINWKGHEAALFFLEGDIIYAKFKDLKGEKALYQIIRLEEGEFTITKPNTIPERNIYDSWKGLLLEGMRVMDESEKERTTIVKTVALDLSQHPSIRKVLILSEEGEIIQNNGFNGPEEYGALAGVLIHKANQVSNPLTLGDVIYASFSMGDVSVFFFDCDGFRIAAEISRETDLGPLFRLVDDLKKKLKTAVETQTE